ncbi:MAG: tetratricopeptide repeat protein [Campylobacterota bacterium]|nr:tetratricopeptide repeat protein [Campylobacterota bacterium]
MRKIILMLFSIYLMTFSHAKEQNLTATISKLSDESIHYYNQKKYEKSIATFEKLIKIIHNDFNWKQIKKDLYLETLYAQVVYPYLFLGEKYAYQKAIEYLKKSLSLQKKYNFSKLEIADTYLLLGEIYALLKNQSDTEKYYLHGIQILENSTKGQDEKILKSYQQLITFYTDTYNYQKQAMYLKQILPYIKDNKTLAERYFQLYSASLILGNNIDALKYIRKSIEHIEDEKRLIIVYHFTAILYRKLGNIEYAINYFEKSLNVSKKINTELLLGENYYNLSASYRNLFKYQKTIFFAKKAIPFYLQNDKNALATPSLLTSEEKLLALYQRLHISYIYLGDNKSAKEYYDIGIKLQEKLKEMENPNKKLYEIPFEEIKESLFKMSYLKRKIDDYEINYLLNQSSKLLPQAQEVLTIVEEKFPNDKESLAYWNHKIALMQYYLDETNSSYESILKVFDNLTPYTNSISMLLSTKTKHSFRAKNNYIDDLLLISNTYKNKRAKDKDWHTFTQINKKVISIWV